MTSPRTSDDSHRHAVRATSILGGASVINVALGLIRMKVAAVVLGPIGVGVIGLLQNLLNAAATVGGLNIGVAGARQIVASEEAGGQDAAASARRATLITASVMAVASAFLFWLLRNALSTLIFGNHYQATNVGFLALGVAATAAAGYQTAVLTAARRIGDLARLSVISAAVAAIVGSIWILIGHSTGIVPFILASPVATLAFGWIFVRRLPAKSDAPAVEPLEPHVANLLRLGAALTVSIFVSLCGQLLVRTMIERKLGGVKLGHFQAAWTITTVYLFFIFQSMGSNYLPRLTAVMRDREEAQMMVCVQAEVGMILAAPILLTMIGAAPWVLSILYTSQFVEASTLLRWQMLGDLLRLASWPIGFVLLAGGAARDYTIADVAGTMIIVVAAWLLIPVAGLSAPGIAYVIMNLCYCGAVMGLVSRRYAIGLSAQLARLFALLAVSCVVVFVLAGEFPLGSSVVGVSAAALWALFGFSRLQRYGALPFGPASPK